MDGPWHELFDPAVWPSVGDALEQGDQSPDSAIRRLDRAAVVQTRYRKAQDKAEIAARILNQAWEAA